MKIALGRVRVLFCFCWLVVSCAVINWTRQPLEMPKPQVALGEEDPSEGTSSPSPDLTSAYVEMKDDCSLHVRIESSEGLPKHVIGVPRGVDGLGAHYVAVDVRGPEALYGALWLHPPRKGYVLRNDTPLMVHTDGEYGVEVTHVFRSYEGINERVEDVTYPYVLKKVATKTVRCRRKRIGGVDDSRPVCRSAQDATHFGYWLREAPLTTNFRSTLKGYWIQYPGEPRYETNMGTIDLLGRRRDSHSYSWHPRDCILYSMPRPELLDLLRDKVLHFVGDSHNRILFYGFLSRLNIGYAPNRIYKGDRVDFIRSHNVSVRFTSSYFLNVSTASFQSVMRRATGKENEIIITGVGQHHSCHCWTLEKHLGEVRRSMGALLTKYQPRQIIWLGVPAQPYNRHMFVFQHRKDCRNNLRHELMSELQKKEAAQRGISFVDLYSTSVAMIHTTLDGAHYYTWVRESWIDLITTELQKMRDSQ